MTLTRETFPKSADFGTGKNGTARAESPDMTTTVKLVNVSEINKGDTLVCAAHRAKSGCSMLGRDVCSHKECTVEERRFTVVGKRRAPKGTRVELRHADGWGCKVVADTDGNLGPLWSVVR